MAPLANSPDYATLFTNMKVNGDKVIHLNALIDRIKTNQSRYESVGNELQIPWAFIAAVHYRESNSSFDHHLHNGDPLTGRTIHVPKNRPVTGTPPFTWEFSATDALKGMGLSKIGGWNLVNTLHRLEMYNGMGYSRKGLVSPYLWSWSNNYQKGKYVADGTLDPNAVDQQCGTSLIIQKLLPDLK